MQMVKAFYDPTEKREHPSLPAPPNEEMIRVYLAQNNTFCPLNKIIVSKANKGNMRTLRRFAFTALKRFNRSCRGCNFGMYAASGQGKTFIVRQWAKTIGIPFVSVQAASLPDTFTLFEMIKEEFERHRFEGDPLCQVRNPKFPTIREFRSEDGSDFSIPPCIVFIDEAHKLPSKLMTAGLLNAMERDDGMMQVKLPGTRSEALMVNCREVCWVAATTERGMLFDAFENRLGTAIEWYPAEKPEVAHIVNQRLDEYVENEELPFIMPVEVCEQVAERVRVPREAISFAHKVIQQRDMMPSDTWEQAVQRVATDLGIDEWGFTRKQIQILCALGQRPIAESRLAGVAQCRLEQVQRYELPSLMNYNREGGPLAISLSGRGICITEAGLRELDRRGVPHKGRRVTAEHFESRR